MEGIKAIRTASGLGSGIGLGSGMEATTEDNSLSWNTTAYVLSYSSAPWNTTSEETISPDEYIYVLYIGGGISMFSCLVALFTYTSSRKFRVKRPYIITINLCISLIIFYMGIIISVTSARRMISDGLTKTCVAGAVLFEFGALCTWTWTAIHWWYLTYSVLSLVTSHISQFAIKVALPAYGIPFIVTGTMLIANSISKNNDFVSEESCVFKLDMVFTITLNILYLLICFVGIALCASYCVLRITCKKAKNEVPSTRKRIKINVIRLTVITIGIMVISVLEIIRNELSGNYPVPWFNIMDGIILGLAGLMVSVGLTLRSKEFRLYLVARGQSAESVRRIVRTLRGKGNSHIDSDAKQMSGSQRSRKELSLCYDEIRHPHHIPRDDIFDPAQTNSAPAPYTKPEPQMILPDVPSLTKRDDDLPKPVDYCAPQYDKKTTISRVKSVRTSVLQVMRNKSGSTTLITNRRINYPQVQTRTRPMHQDLNRASIYSVDMQRKSSF